MGNEQMLTLCSQFVYSLFLCSSYFLAKLYSVRTNVSLPKYNAGQRPGKVVDMTEHDVCEILKNAMPESAYVTKLLTIASVFYGFADRQVDIGRNETARILKRVADSILSDLEERGVINRD